jgi:perosamine synthetase
MIPIAKPIISTEEKEAVMKVMESGMLAQGKRVQELEVEFAKYSGTKYAIAVNSGTAALHASLYALGIKEGDEVITTPFTFIATANSIIMQNAKPVFVDIEKDTFNIDPKKIIEKITPKTKAILFVDLFGHIANIDEIKKIAKEHNLKLIEDACQAHGAEFKDQKAGTFGDMAAFSFYATKNMMCGEGGIITTDNEEYMELAKRFRHHGQSEQTRYQYYDLGYNYRMLDITAAIALVQLKKVEDFTEKRIHNAKLLNEGLSKITWIQIPKIIAGYKHVYHQYTIKVDETIRDKLIEYLKENEIGCGVFYPKPLHLHPFFIKQGYKEGDFPVSEEISKQVISLPVNPAVSEEDVEKIIKVIGDFNA